MPRASGPTYVLVHGIGTSHRYLRRLHRYLQASADVYSVDLPGFGSARTPLRSPSVARLAMALGALIDERVPGRDVILVGHSMGAQWVVEVAAQRPASVRALVLIGPVVDDRHRTLAAQFVRLARDIAREPLLANLVVGMDYLRCGPVWFLREARHMVAFRIDERVARLAVPVLVVRGGDDPIAEPGWCRRLSAAASDGTSVTVPGHRHLVHFTAPRAVGSAITHFARRAGPW